MGILNHPDMQPFIYAVGSLITNFGTIEFAADAWIDGLSGGTRPALDPVFRDRFRSRVKLVVDLLVQAQVPPELAKEARGLWERALELSNTKRNPRRPRPLRLRLAWNREKGAA